MSPYAVQLETQPQASQMHSGGGTLQVHVCFGSKITTLANMYIYKCTCDIYI